MAVETHATMSGHCVNGWVPVGNILIVLTRTGALNLRAARRELPDGLRVHHSSNMTSSCGQENLSVVQASVKLVSIGLCRLAQVKLF
jgi:hypothetical protein